jgi:rhodanese-related sulfurtransferase
MLQPTPPVIPAVEPGAVNDLIDGGAVLIDVRERKEWDRARIAGAELKPLSQANSWYQDLPQDRDIVFYCRSGNRSGQIVQALVQQVGMSNVYNMTGGIIAWADGGLPVEN